MNRREFITLLRGAAAVWPLAARAQHGQSGCGALACSCPPPRTDPEWQALFGAFLHALALFWVGPSGRNVRIDTRWAITPGDIPRQTSPGRIRQRSRQDASSWLMAPRP